MSSVVVLPLHVVEQPTTMMANTRINGNKMKNLACLRLDRYGIGMESSSYANKRDEICVGFDKKKKKKRELNR